MMPPRTPSALRTGSMNSELPVIVPASRSLWPPRYFVALWITPSAPRSSARWLYGAANVESMMTFTPRSCAMRQTSGTSATRRYGFVGDSVKKSFVFGRIASASLPLSPGSMTVVSTPQRLRNWLMNCRVLR
jgi:hypothetical protein